MKERQSNFELLRIIAMLLVVLVHVQHVMDNTSPVVQSIALMGVPLFTMISGWFGIKPNLRSFLSFLFQCLFFSVGFTALALILGKASFEPQDFFLTWYWYVVAYIGLYLMAPVLNVFVEHASEKEFRYFLLTFFTFEFLYGFLCQSSAGFNYGLTLIGLVSLYLLARYVRKYPNKITSLNRNWDLIIAVALIAVESLLAFFFSALDISSERTALFSYTSPFVILSSLFVLLFFSKLKFQSRIVNYVASSCIAVYLFHAHRTILNFAFKDAIMCAKDNGLKILGTMLAFFAIAVIIDQLRKLCWHYISKLVFNKNGTYRNFENHFNH